MKDLSEILDGFYELHKNNLISINNNGKIIHNNLYVLFMGHKGIRADYALIKKKLIESRDFIHTS